MKKEDLELIIKEGEGLTVEFKEKYSPKIAQDIVALANSKGGKILLGVTDDGKIKGEKLTGQLKAEIVDLAKNCKPAITVAVKQVEGVIVLDVHEGSDKPHACSLGFYKRLDAVTQKLDPNEIRKIFKSEASFHFDARINTECTLEDLSLKKVKEFLEESETKIKITKTMLPNLLESLKLMHKGKLTNAAVWMFAKDVSRFMLHCQTKLIAFKGTEGVNIYDKNYVRDDLLTQFKEALLFCKKHLNERAEIRGANRYDILEIPLEAIREAIINALIHRDYTMSGTNVQIEVHADRLVIYNPGGLPEGLPFSMLGKKSVRRNELVADLFHRMDKAECIGTGVQRIKSLVKEAGGKAPKFESDTFFTVTFDRPKEDKTQNNPPKTGGLTGGLNDELKFLFEVVSKNPGIQAKALKELLNKIPLRTLERQIKTLIEMNLIERRGSRKTGGYFTK